FASQYQDKLQSLDLMSAKESNSVEWKNHESEITQHAQQLLIEEIGPQWLVIRQNIDAILNPSLAEKKETQILSEVNFQNLGIEELLNPHTHKNSKSIFKKSFKGEKHLEIASKMLQSLVLDLEVSSPFENKANVHKMELFYPQYSKS